MNLNFDLRCSIMNVSEVDRAMAEGARSLGASAKLTGSGGAIIGMVESDEMMSAVTERLSGLGAVVLEPTTG